MDVEAGDNVSSGEGIVRPCSTFRIVSIKPSGIHGVVNCVFRAIPDELCRKCRQVRRR